MMTRWQTVKEIKGEDKVYEFGKFFICGDAMVFAMEIGMVSIRGLPIKDSEGGYETSSRILYRVSVPALKMSALATWEGIDSE